MDESRQIKAALSWLGHNKTIKNIEETIAVVSNGGEFVFYSVDDMPEAIADMLENGEADSFQIVKDSFSATTTVTGVGWKLTLGGSI